MTGQFKLLAPEDRILVRILYEVQQTEDLFSKPDIGVDSILDNDDIYETIGALSPVIQGSERIQVGVTIDVGPRLLSDSDGLNKCYISRPLPQVGDIVAIKLTSYEMARVFKYRNNNYINIGEYDIICIFRRSEDKAGDPFIPGDTFETIGKIGPML